MMSEARNLPAERKAQMTTGAPVAALVPQTLEEAYRLSQALAASGMVPRGIDKPEQILVAIMAGAELGLAPFQSLQSFAVVNGRPTLWGDGLMAVVRAKGVQVKEWIEGEDDQMVAHCLVTRPDTGEEIKRTFSVADAKKAALWGKQGPWQQYPKRMLAMRARVAIRDGCADMLRGIQIREEVEDFTHVRDITPKPSGLAARLGGPSGEGFNAARAEEDEPVAFAEQAEEIAEAEFETAPAPEAEPEPQAPLAADEAPPADGFDPVDWAASFTRGLAALETATDVTAAWSQAKAKGYVRRLRDHSEPMAQELARAMNERVAELNGTADQ
jgi:hypothetical protein